MFPEHIFLTGDIAFDGTIDDSLRICLNVSPDFAAVHLQLGAFHIAFNVALLSDTGDGSCHDITHHAPRYHDSVLHFDTALNDGIRGNHADALMLLHHLLSRQLTLIFLRHHDFGVFLRMHLFFGTIPDTQCFHHLVTDTLLVFLCGIQRSGISCQFLRIK